MQRRLLFALALCLTVSAAPPTHDVTRRRRQLI